MSIFILEEWIHGSFKKETKHFTTTDVEVVGLKSLCSDTFSAEDGNRVMCQGKIGRCAGANS